MGAHQICAARLTDTMAASGLPNLPLSLEYNQGVKIKIPPVAATDSANPRLNAMKGFQIKSNEDACARAAKGLIDLPVAVKSTITAVMVAALITDG